MKKNEMTKELMEEFSEDFMDVGGGIRYHAARPCNGRVLSPIEKA